MCYSKRQKENKTFFGYFLHTASILCSYQLHILLCSSIPRFVHTQHCRLFVPLMYMFLAWCRSQPPTHLPPPDFDWNSKWNGKSSLIYGCRDKKNNCMMVINQNIVISALVGWLAGWHTWLAASLAGWLSDARLQLQPKIEEINFHYYTHVLPGSTFNELLPLLLLLLPPHFRCRPFAASMSWNWPPRFHGESIHH